MPVKIAVASGKGGTGKTTVAVNLFHFISKNTAFSIQLVDCDVEEPNVLLFFPEAVKKQNENIHQLIPEIDNESCTYCRKCAEYCEFNAIVVIPPSRFAEVNSSLCHSCGACSVACKFDAITEVPQSIGEVNTFETFPAGTIREGRLKIGSAMQTLMIKELKKTVHADTDLILYDAPPGTSCPVVETISDADFIILVTEPTPFGLYDLSLTVDLLKDMNKAYGVIINKAGLGDHKVYTYLKEEKINLIAEIPFDISYASKYAKGDLLGDVPEIFADQYRKIADQLINVHAL